MRDALSMKLRAQDGVERDITWLSNGVICCLTVWAVTNSVVLAANYSYVASRLFSRVGWSTVLICAAWASLTLPLIGFALASVAIINDPASRGARCAFTLAAAVIGQFAYMILTVRVY